GCQADALKGELQAFESIFLQAYRSNLGNKLGLQDWTAGDDDLLDEWWRLLHTQRADFTLSFRALATAPQQRAPFLAYFKEDPAAANAWLDRYIQRLAQDGREDGARIKQMNSANPIYVLRNHLAEGAIRAAVQGDASEIDTLRSEER